MPHDLLPPPREGIRAMPPGELHEDGKTLTGRLARAGEWAEIESVTEGHFLERNQPGAFKKTFAENYDKIRLLFQHGKDPDIGGKPIAEVRELGEDDEGPYYRAEILDGVPPLIVDGLRRGLYGSSHSFRVIREDWEPRPKAASHNPNGIPERTIKEAMVYEISAVTWPAYAGATASLRSMTDEFTLDSLTSNPTRLRELVDYIAEPAAPSLDAEAEPHLEERRDTPDLPPPPVAAPAPEDPPTGGPSALKEHPVSEYTTPEDRANRISELKAEASRLGVEYPGVLPTEAQERWDALWKEHDTLVADARAWEERQQRLADTNARQDPRQVERTYEPFNVVRTRSDLDIYDVAAIEREGTEKRAQLFQDNAMRSVERASFPHPASVPDEFRARIEYLLNERDTPDKELARRILVSGSPIYKRAFNKSVIGAPLTAEEQRAAALAVTGTTTTGGYMIPYVFDPTIIPIGAHTSINPFRAACRVETIVGGNKWVGVSATNIAAIYEAEAAAATEAGPTIGQPTMTVQRASAFVSLSRETLQDKPDIASDLSVLIQEGKDTLEEAQFAVGTGATVYPFGMFTTLAFTNLDTATNDTTAVGDIYLTEATLPLRYQLNAAWFMSRNTLRLLQAFETTGGTLFGGVNYANTPYPNANAIGNTGVTLLGRPVWEVPSAPHGLADFTTDGKILWVYGDPKRYVIVDRAGMEIEMIPNLFDGAGKPKGQRGLFAFWRNTARPIIDGTDGMISLSVQ